MMKQALALAVLLVIVAVPAAALACDCPAPKDTKHELEKATAVVVARVASVDEPMIHDTGTISWGPVTIRISVTRAWKGAKAGDTITIARPPERSTCDYQLDQGQ